MEADASFAADAVRVALAFVLALPVGLERERSGTRLGTYPLLSACACGFLRVAQHGGGPREVADVLFGMLGGIAFVGTGAIVRTPGRVSGLSLPVSLWVTGAIGAGVALGAPLISAALSLLSALTLWVGARFASRREPP